MKTYTFYLHQGSEAVPAFEIEQFETRDAALQYALALLADRPRYDQVAVTEEEQEIARLPRTDAVSAA